MIEQNVLERIYKICNGKRIHNVTYVYARMPDTPHHVVDEGIEIWVDLGRLQADINRQDLMDGPIRAISNIRGWEVGEDAPLDSG